MPHTCLTFQLTNIYNLSANYWKTSFLVSLRAAGDFALLTDESTDEAGRARLSIFSRFVDGIMHTPKEEFICIRKLGASKTSEAIMQKLEEMFIDKTVEKTLIRFSGMDGTNCMSGTRNGLQRRIQHVSTYALYMNCRNHRLALCLVHLLKKYDNLVAVDSLLLAIWKKFKYSSIKQAVFENAQIVEGMQPLKILKACTTRWLTHGDTSVRVISRFGPLVAVLDNLFHEKKDPEAKGTHDQLLTPDIILMLLLLAEVLVPINMFCKFLQTRNLNYGLVVNKFQRLVNKLERIKDELPNHNSVKTDLKHVKRASERLHISAEQMELASKRRSNTVTFGQEVSEKVAVFIRTVGEPLI